jgi:hypothetical protein
MSFPSRAALLQGHHIRAASFPIRGTERGQSMGVLRAENYTACYYTEVMTELFSDGFPRTQELSCQRLTASEQDEPAQQAVFPFSSLSADFFPRGRILYSHSRCLGLGVQPSSEGDFERGRLANASFLFWGGGCWRSLMS